MLMCLCFAFVCAVSVCLVCSVSGLCDLIAVLFDCCCAWCAQSLLNALCHTLLPPPLWRASRVSEEQVLLALAAITHRRKQRASKVQYSATVENREEEEEEEEGGGGGGEEEEEEEEMRKM